MRVSLAAREKKTTAFSRSKLIEESYLRLVHSTMQQLHQIVKRWSMKELVATRMIWRSKMKTVVRKALLFKMIDDSSQFTTN